MRMSFIFQVLTRRREMKYPKSLEIRRLKTRSKGNIGEGMRKGAGAGSCPSSLRAPQKEDKKVREAKRLSIRKLTAPN